MEKNLSLQPGLLTSLNGSASAITPLAYLFGRVPQAATRTQLSRPLMNFGEQFLPHRGGLDNTYTANFDTMW